VGSTTCTFIVVTLRRRLGFELNIYRYKGLRVKQNPKAQVIMLAANPKDVLSFADIERVSRDSDGTLKGFQRHQIAPHIKDIRAYLSREDAVLPNAVIVAFVDGIKDVEIAFEEGKPGFVVDGQQRLSALQGVEREDFEVFVSVLVCESYNDLRQQFVLINNTRPLPKALIYELLPDVDGLPDRFTARRFAARVAERLNHDQDSSLFGEIRQHTNPSGMLSDTAIHKLIMNSASDGAIRSLIQFEDREDRAVYLVNQFFQAVKEVYAGEWHGLSPRHSRLRHGAGLVAMGFVMDYLFSAGGGATEKDEFIPGVKALVPYTAWTSGQWQFADDDIRPWNGIQNTPIDIDALTTYLLGSLRREQRRARRRETA
jgi:DGQHR domain-containing protein